MPRILSLSKRAAVHAKQLEVMDPLVMELADIGATDESYVQIINDVGNGISPRTYTRAQS